MKNLMKILCLIFLTFTLSGQAQQTESFKNQLKTIEANKILYIGKTINNLLDTVSYPVKSYMSSSFTGKTNHVTFYFITNGQVRQRSSSPIILRVYFTQEKEIKIIDAMLMKNQLSWTAEEKAFFGNLIVKDIYVGGNL